MNEQIVDRADCKPDKCKQRAHYTHDIAPPLTVIPQSYVEYLEQEQSAKELNDIHHDTNDQDNQPVARTDAVYFNKI